MLDGCILGKNVSVAHSCKHPYSFIFSKKNFCREGEGSLLSVLRPIGKNVPLVYSPICSIFFSLCKMYRCSCTSISI